MRRVLDIVLVVVILVAVGFGAYRLGRLVDHTSHQAALASEGVNTSSSTGTTTVNNANPSNGPSRRTIETVIIAVAGAAGVMLIVQIGGSLFRTRKREKWHA